eukprot:jgi/Tetstr1/429171/TSEL_019124.t1
MCPGRFRGMRMQVVGANEPPLHHVPRMGTQQAGASGPPLHDCASTAFAAPDTHGRRHQAATAPECPGRFRGMRTQLFGSNMPSLHQCAPGRLRGLRKELLGANKRSQHHVPRWSAPTDLHCTMCHGRFRGPDTQMVGAIEPPPHIVPRPDDRPDLRGLVRDAGRL